LVIGICNFDIVCILSIVIWDFMAVSMKANRFYLNYFELILMLPWAVEGKTCLIVFNVVKDFQKSFKEEET